mmetsp:Transcript_15230/g.53498  ORF Transcript_15230/g.53498 Transcript_15230/m.53498 type:complete len:280 (+) Transcript_15230:651-1490(+)
MQLARAPSTARAEMPPRGRWGACGPGRRKQPCVRQRRARPGSAPWIARSAWCCEPPTEPPSMARATSRSSLVRWSVCCGLTGQSSPCCELWRSERRVGSVYSPRLLRRARRRSGRSRVSLPSAGALATRRRGRPLLRLQLPRRRGAASCRHSPPPSVAPASGWAPLIARARGRCRLLRPLGIAACICAISADPEQPRTWRPCSWVALFESRRAVCKAAVCRSWTSHSSWTASAMITIATLGWALTSCACVAASMLALRHKCSDMKHRPAFCQALGGLGR